MAKNVEVVKAPQFTDADLTAITDFQSFGELLKSKNIGFESFDSYGTGFKVLADKALLLKVPFFILEGRLSHGDRGEFVSLLIVTKTPILIDGMQRHKLVINDGSTGIREQWKSLQESRKEAGTADLPLYVDGGLRVSEYDYVDEKTGDFSRAKTYYLS